VVDNNSIDNPKKALLEKFGNKIICVELPENIGFGRANNEGVKTARGRNLFFLNSDTVLLTNAVKILSDYLDEHLDAGCCGGNLVDEDGRPTHSFLRYFSPSTFGEIVVMFSGIPGKLLYGKNIMYNNSYKPLEVAYISGADLMIKKELFESLHGFNPDFFMYYEETELTHRVKKLKYKVCNVPQSKIIHLVGKSFSDNKTKTYLFFYSRKVYLRKTHTYFTGCVCNCIFSLTLLYCLSVSFIKGNRNKSRCYKNELLALFNNW
jgi:GT2 family glycosyltransferase